MVKHQWSFNCENWCFFFFNFAMTQRQKHEISKLFIDYPLIGQHESNADLTDPGAFAGDKS